ncbi:MAG TPA: Na+/H+ antiporter NhaC family protein [Candidatus Aphodousia gallistercoris]|nr:Na+/H+ antiporter NhaC family protein [Candidatus Aphodousia gallistercoris]
MDPFNAGWLSILPPLIAITLALTTKEVISSLLVGILSGTLIYSVGMGHPHVLMGTVESAFNIMATKVDFNILVFCTLLGALVYVISMAGGSRAYGEWAIKRIRTRRASLLASGGLGAFIFIDDYFNCLTVGTVMRPVTDTYKVSRAKLAYIIDSMAAPVCIIAPISSWAAAVGSSLKSTGAFESDFAAFVSTIPFNFYAICCIAMVFALCIWKLDFGPMRRSEERAELGDVGNTDTETASMKVSEKGTIWDMLIPIGALIVFSVLCLMYSGGYWGTDPQYHSFQASLGNSSASSALVWASFGAMVVAFVLFVPRGVVSFRNFMDGSVEGMKMMLPANIILVLAWTISGVCRDLLQTPLFVESLVTDGGFSAMWLPAAVFIIAAFLSFSTGTAWGTFGILIPIVVPIAQALDPNLLVVSLSATLAGSVFGDHCSPISDTTILSSAGAGCSHIEHVSTQLPYACVVALAAFVGYVCAGITHANAVASLAASLITLFILVIGLHLYGNAKRKAALKAS